MFLKDFYSQQDNFFQFSQQQASQFAKKIANDYNKIHDVDNKRFCVPGDLLFSVSLAELGLYPSMKIEFTGMVKNDIALQFMSQGDNETAIVNAENQPLMQLETAGEPSHDSQLISKIIKDYVHFSGKNFPDILVPLMCQENLMFNPARALVMYKSMEISMSRVDLDTVQLKYGGATISVHGKRATVIYKFCFYNGDEKVGSGEKEMLLSGLIPYEEAAMNDVIADYQAAKAEYLSTAC
ncbi:MAG: hypothetical protein ACI86X_001501 [Moritella sp.]|jgi:hypothetical protein